MRSRPTATPVPPGKIYVGDYEARTTPIADTDRSDSTRPETARFAPGTYKVMFVAPGWGATRSTITVTAPATVTKTFSVSPNLASSCRRSHGDRVQPGQPQRRLA